MLQIPSMTKEDSIFYFNGGLQNWVKQELQMWGIRSLVEAISATDSLSNFTTNDQPKSNERQDGYSEKGGGDNRGSRHICPRRDERGSSLEMIKLPYSKGFGKSSSWEENKERKR